MDNTVHALIKEVNSWETLAYKEETKEKSNTFQTEEKIEIIHNLITNLISEEKLLTILKKIQEVINQHPKIISKEEWDIKYTDLIQYEIYLENNCLIKKLVKYVNLRLADWLKKELKRMETMGSSVNPATLTLYQ